MHEITLKNRIAVILIAVVCALLILFSIIGLRRLTSRSRNYDTTADGRTYLRQLAARDLSSIDETLAAQKRAHEAAERDQRMKELTDGTVDVWSYFTDYVLFGDSRAVGFSYYGFLAESRVIADSGWTIRDLEDNLDSIAAMNPSSVYLAFGLNDVGLGFWNTPEDYGAEFASVLDSISERLPNASIYVNSILPVTEAAANENGNAWANISAYSTALSQVCRDKNVVFIDNDALVAEHMDMFDVDGIHMVRDFYPLWAANMMLTIYGSAPSTVSDTDGTGEDADSEDGTYDETYSEDYDTYDTYDATFIIEDPEDYETAPTDAEADPEADY